MMLLLYHKIVEFGQTDILVIMDFCFVSNFDFLLPVSHFHRYNLPELAKSYKVYALDLLGFGWSDKAIIEYDAMVWRDQVVDFLKEIVKEPAVLVGNR